jgi:serine/threonine-protein kinase
MTAVGSATPSFPPGYLVGGRYELIERLGQGGHGAVYRAIQRPLGREVAVKMILAEALFAEGMLERFAREAALVQRLEHPNTVRIYDFGTSEQGMPFIVFELLRGRTLEQEIAQCPLTALRIGRVATQVLKSLMEAHALGIVHRDIKPANLLLIDYSGEADFVKVLDFGVAKPTAAPKPGEAITHDGQIVGTPSYMAPEQVHGAVIGPTADIYALGLVMAEAATGQRVYGEGSPMQIWMKQTSPEPVPLSPLVMSTALGTVIARATRKAPEQRYQSAEAMLADVERALLSGSGPTDPLAKPLVVVRAPELPRVTARLTREPSPPPQPPPPTPLVMTYGTAPAPPAYPPQAAWAPPPPMRASQPSQPGSSPTGGMAAIPLPAPAGASTAIVVLGVVAIVAVVVAVGAGAALYLTRSGTASSASSSTSQPGKAHLSLTAVTPDRTEQRLRTAGWAVRRNDITGQSGFKGLSFSGTRGTSTILVSLFEYDQAFVAEYSVGTMRQSPGAVAERDGGKILSVIVSGDPAQSQATFDDLVK